MNKQKVIFQIVGRQKQWKENWHLHQERLALEQRET